MGQNALVEDFVRSEEACRTESVFVVQLDPLVVLRVSSVNRASVVRLQTSVEWNSAGNAQLIFSRTKRVRSDARNVQGELYLIGDQEALAAFQVLFDGGGGQQRDHPAKNYLSAKWKSSLITSQRD